MDSKYWNKILLILRGINMYKDKKTQIATMAIVIILFTSTLLFCSGINFGPVSAVKKKTKKISNLESATTNNSILTILTSPLDGNYEVGNFFQAEDGIRYWSVTGVQTCALPI